MSEKDFTKLVRSAVMFYVNKIHPDDEPINEDNVFIVWLTKVLKNNKALATTNLPDDMYFEVTYNGEAREAYVDAYRKECNFSIKVEE